MVESTARLGMPLLVAGQGQKDVTLNEALLAIDAMLGASVQRRDLAVPPSDAAPGACWLVPEGAEGEWAGEAGRLAAWTAGGWRFHDMAEGMSLYILAEGETLRRTASGWMTLSPRGAPAPAVAEPTGGTVVDAEARTVLALVLARLRDLELIAV